MQKALIVINPISGGKNKKPVIDLIQQKLSKDISYELIYWEKPEQKGDIIKRLQTENFDLAIAVGGDGTINQVASAVVNSNKKLGIIPMGSGNGLARHLNIPLKPIEAIEVINKGKHQQMDACAVNGTYFFCTSGVGFDAQIGQLFSETKARGFFTYVKLTLGELMKYQPQDYTIKINGEIINHKAFLITVANASQYGNNAYIAPQAKVEDGLLDVCVMKPFNLARAASMGVKMFNKTLNNSPGMEVYKASEVTIERANNGAIHFDGEPLLQGVSLSYKVHPGALRVIVA